MIDKKQLFMDGLTKTYKLTKHGIIKLSLFDLTTLQAGLEKAKARYTIHKIPVLLQHCIQTYKINDRKVSWSDYYAQIEQAGIQQSDPLVEQSNQAPIISIPSPVRPTSLKKNIYIEVLAKGIEFLGALLPDDIIKEIQEIIKTGSCIYPEFTIISTKYYPQTTQAPIDIQSIHDEQDHSLKLIFVTYDEEGNELRTER